jgi:flagellar hook assembly protein FlgD
MVTVVRGTITGVEGEEGLPASFALMQNYPNPFNPTTTIRYALPVQSTVTLRIYDVIGREVATLINGVVQAGYHDVAWTTTNSSGALLSSGMYFYRLEARPTDGSEPFIQLKKMMLLK